MDQINEFFNSTIGTRLVNLGAGLIILLIGYILARIIASVIRRLLKRTKLDNRIADAEDIIAKVVFWVLMIFVFVAFFDRIATASGWR